MDSEVLDKDNYLESTLYLSLVEYYENGRALVDVHVLRPLSDDEAFDLNLNKKVYSYGSDDIFLQKSLISFSELAMTSRINFYSYSREDALKAGAYYKDKYLKFLRVKNIKLELKK